MPRIPTLIDELRRRSDVVVEDQKDAWLVRIPKSDGLACEITIPFRVLEWFADVKRNGEEKKVWSDWMDYFGYDDSPEEKLEAEMADDISAFIQRVTAEELRLPLQIYEKTAPQIATDNSGLRPSCLSSNIRQQSMAIEKPVWIFHAASARFAGGAFEEVALAEAWIGKHRLSGILTAYPRDEGCLDWAIRTGNLGMKKEKLDQKRSDPSFIGGFTSAAQEHIHFEDGKRT